jgi:hypothetical protein
MATSSALLGKNETISRAEHNRTGAGLEAENPGQAGHTDSSAAHQPFELLPALAGGSPPAEELPGHESNPEHRNL